MGKWEGATWLRHGLPRGTHLLDRLVGKMFVSMRFEPASSGVEERIGKARLANPPLVWFLTYSGSVNI